LERETVSRATSSPELDSSPVWSPDGKRIAYGYRTGLESFIKVKAADAPEDGQELSRVLQSSTLFLSDWPPDGRFVLFTDQPGVTVDIRAARVADGKVFPILVTEFSERVGRPFPGREVAGVRIERERSLRNLCTPLPLGRRRTESGQRQVDDFT
jgi:hypothetical protein